MDIVVKLKEKRSIKAISIGKKILQAIIRSIPKIV